MAQRIRNECFFNVLIQKRKTMKKITLIFITLAFALSSCATQRTTTTSQRPNNLPPVYISLKNILVDNGLCDRSLVFIDGVVQENANKKINFNIIEFILNRF